MPKVKTGGKPELGGNKQSDKMSKRKLNFTNVVANKPRKVSAESMGRGKSLVKLALTPTEEEMVEDKLKNGRKRKKSIQDNVKSGCSTSTRDIFNEFEEPLDYEPSIVETSPDRDDESSCPNRSKISRRMSLDSIKKTIIENTNVPVVKLSDFNSNSDLLRKYKFSNSNPEIDEDSEETSEETSEEESLAECQVKARFLHNRQRATLDEENVSSNNIEPSNLFSESFKSSRETANQRIKRYSPDQGVQGNNNPPGRGSNHLNHDGRTAVIIHENLVVMKSNSEKSREVIKGSSQNNNNCRNGQKVDYFNLSGQIDENDGASSTSSQCTTNSIKPYRKSTSPKLCSRKMTPVNFSIKISTADNRRTIMTGSERPQNNDEHYNSHCSTNNDSHTESIARSSPTVYSEYNWDEEVDSMPSMDSEDTESQLDYEPEEPDQSDSFSFTLGDNRKTDGKDISKRRDSQQSDLHSGKVRLNTRLQKSSNDNELNSNHCPSEPNERVDSNGKFASRKWTSETNLNNDAFYLTFSGQFLEFSSTNSFWTIMKPILIDVTFDPLDAPESDCTFKMPSPQTSDKSKNIPCGLAEIKETNSDTRSATTLNLDECTFKVPPPQTRDKSKNIPSGLDEIRKTKSVTSSTTTVNFDEGTFKRPPPQTSNKARNTPYNLPEIEEGKSDVLSLYPEFDIEVAESVCENKSMPSNSEETSLPSDSVHRWLRRSVTPSSNFEQVIFKRTCLYWLNGYCVRKAACKYNHSLSKTSIRQIRSLDYDHLLLLYDYAKKNLHNNCHRYRVLFKHIMTGLKKFINYDGAKQFLLGTVNTILSSEMFNKGDLINVVIDALTAGGDSINEAIEVIISEYGASNMTLSDILLSIIVSNGNLIHDWNLVVTLLSKRTVSLDFAVVDDLLNQCLNLKPLDMKLLTSIKEEILDKNLVQAWKIKDTLDKFNAVYNLPSRSSVSDFPTTNPEVSSDSDVDRSVGRSEQDNKSDSSSTSVKSNRSRRRDSFSSSSSSSSDGYRKRTVTCTRRFSEENASEVDMKSGADTFQKELRPSTSGGVINNRSTIDEDLRLESCPSEQGNLINYKTNFRHTSSSTVSTDEDLRVSTDEDLRSATPRSDLSYYATYEYKDNQKIATRCSANCKFGHLQLNENYVFSKSLHKDFLAYNVNIDIETKDIPVLKDCIDRMDGQRFMCLLEKYIPEATIQKFICHVLAFLKRSSICFALKYLIHAIEEKNPYFLQQNCYKAAFEVIVFNYILYLENIGDWADIIYLLNKFSDWDSLITSKCLNRVSIKYTLMGRYIYLCKLFISAENHFWPNEIFQSDHLNLLKSTLYWPYYNLKEIDIALRNKVLETFFKKDFWLDNSVNDLYKCIARLGGVTGYDVWPHFNKRLLWLLENYRVTFWYIRCFLRDLVNVYAKYLETNIIRSIAICIPGEVTEENAVLSFYDVCCERGIYESHDRNMSEIIIRNNLLDPEIALIFQSYFKKLSVTKMLPQHLHISVSVPRGTTNSVILNTVRSATVVTQRIMEILSSCFKISGHYISSSILVVVPTESLVHYVRNPTYTYTLPPFIPRIKEASVISN